MVQKNEIRQGVKSAPDTGAEDYVSENATMSPDEEALNEMAVKGFETQRRIEAVEALSNDEKISRILDLEDQLNTEIEDNDKYQDEMEAYCAKNRATNRTLKACVLGFAALLGVSGWYHYDQKSQIESQANEIAGLNADLRTAAWLDESNSKSVRAVFAEEVQKASEQMADATPVQCVDMAARHIAQLKVDNQMAIEGFQIRVISDDLFALARTAEETKTSTKNFLKVVRVYADQKPAAYADQTITQTQGRARLDQMLLRAGRMGHQK